jgi:microcephalin
LGDAKVCAEGYEEGLVTHLVMGAERRTLKVLLAIAGGAHLVTGEWVQDSMENGNWQPEGQYRVPSRFSDTADIVRARLATLPRPPRMLEGRQVAVHSISKEGNTALNEHRTGLQRLILVLGGRVSWEVEGNK